MTENFYSQSLESKLYSSESVLIATFFGGPLVGGYMTAENFKFLGETEKVRHTYIITGLMLCVLIGFLQFAQGSHFPWFVFPVSYTLLTYIPMKVLQGKRIRTHMQMGTPLHKGDRVAVISFVGAVATIVGLLIASVLVQAVTTGSVS
jgi:preprotein translocase subunit YajC